MPETQESFERKWHRKHVLKVTTPEHWQIPEGVYFVGAALFEWESDKTSIFGLFSKQGNFTIRVAPEHVPLLDKNFRILEEPMIIPLTDFTEEQVAIETKWNSKVVYKLGVGPGFDWKFPEGQYWTVASVFANRGSDNYFLVLTLVTQTENYVIRVNRDEVGLLDKNFRIIGSVEYARN